MIKRKKSDSTTISETGLDFNSRAKASWPVATATEGSKLEVLLVAFEKVEVTPFLKCMFKALGLISTLQVDPFLCDGTLMFSVEVMSYLVQV